MRKTAYDKRYTQAKEAALMADRNFHLELVRQFGRHAAGDKRYENALHDGATTLAREAKQRADAAFMAAMRERTGSALVQAGISIH